MNTPSSPSFIGNIPHSPRADFFTAFIPFIDENSSETMDIRGESDVSHYDSYYLFDLILKGNNEHALVYAEQFKNLPLTEETIEFHAYLGIVYLLNKNLHEATIQLDKLKGSSEYLIVNFFKGQYFLETEKYLEAFYLLHDLVEKNIYAKNQKNDDILIGILLLYIKSLTVLREDQTDIPVNLTKKAVYFYLQLKKNRGHEAFLLSSNENLILAKALFNPSLPASDNYFGCHLYVKHFREKIYQIKENASLFQAFKSEFSSFIKCVEDSLGKKMNLGEDGFVPPLKTIEIVHYLNFFKDSLASLNIEHAPSCSEELYEAFQNHFETLKNQIGSLFYSPHEGFLKQQEKISQFIEAQFMSSHTFDTSTIFQGTSSAKEIAPKKRKARSSIKKKELDEVNKNLPLPRALEVSNEAGRAKIENYYRKFANTYLAWYEENELNILFQLKKSRKDETLPFLNLKLEFVQDLFLSLESNYTEFKNEAGSQSFLRPCFIHFIKNVALSLSWKMEDAADLEHFLRPFTNVKFKDILSSLIIDQEESIVEFERDLFKDSSICLVELQKKVICWIRENPLKFISSTNLLEQNPPAILLLENKKNLSVFNSSLYFVNGFWPAAFIKNEKSTYLLRQLFCAASIEETAERDFDILPLRLNSKEQLQFKQALDICHFSYLDEKEERKPFLVLKLNSSFTSRLANEVEEEVDVANDDDSDFEPQLKSKRRRVDTRYQEPKKIFSISFADSISKFGGDLIDLFNYDIAQETKKILRRKEFREAQVALDLNRPLHNLISENLRLCPSFSPSLTFGISSLKEYQKKGIEKLLDLYERGVGGGLLAPQPGLGKTRMMARFAMQILMELEKPILVFSPVSTLLQSLQEFRIFFAEAILEIMENEFSHIKEGTKEELSQNNYLVVRTLFGYVKTQHNSYFSEKENLRKRILTETKKLQTLVKKRGGQRNLDGALKEQIKLNKNKIHSLKETLKFIEGQIEIYASFRREMESFAKDNNFEDVLLKFLPVLEPDLDFFERHFNDKSSILMTLNLFEDFIDSETWSDRFAGDTNAIQRKQLHEKRCIVFQNIEALALRFNGLYDMPWSNIHVDEAQKISNHLTQNYRNLHTLINEVRSFSSHPFIVFSTGTPFVNDVKELISYLTLIEPKSVKTPGITSLSTTSNRIELQTDKFLQTLARYLKPKKKNDNKALIRKELFHRLLTLFGLSESFKATFQALSVRILREDVRAEWNGLIPTIVPVSLTPSFEAFEEHAAVIKKLDADYNKKFKKQDDNHLDDSVRFLKHVKEVHRSFFHPVNAVSAKERTRLSKDLSKKSKKELFEYAKQSAFLTSLFGLNEEEFPENSDFNDQLKEGVVFIVDEKAIGYSLKNLIAKLFNAETSIITGEDSAEKRKITVDCYERPFQEGDKRAIILLNKSGAAGTDLSINGKHAHLLTHDFTHAGITQSLSRIVRGNSNKGSVTVYQFKIDPSLTNLSRRIVWHRTRKQKLEEYYFSTLNRDGSNLKELFELFYRGIRRKISFSFYKTAEKELRHELKEFFINELEASKERIIKEIFDRNPLEVEPTIIPGDEEEVEIDEGFEEEEMASGVHPLLAAGELSQSETPLDNLARMATVFCSKEAERGEVAENSSTEVCKKDEKGKEKVVDKRPYELNEREKLSLRKVDFFLQSACLTPAIISESIIETTVQLETHVERRKWWIIPLQMNLDIITPRAQEVVIEEGEIREPQLIHNLEAALIAGRNFRRLKSRQIMPGVTGLKDKGITARCSLNLLQEFASRQTDDLLYHKLQYEKTSKSLEELKKEFFDQGIVVVIYKLVNVEGKPQFFKHALIDPPAPIGREIKLLEIGNGNHFHYDLLFPNSN